MLDHISINVADFEKGKAFYAGALKPLGYAMLMEFKEFSVAGFGVAGKPDFWINGNPSIGRPQHVAFLAESEEVVKAFYDAALAAGGKDNGAPGPRKEYSPGYYAAFVRDLDGHNIEAVFHGRKE
jgi:catechol 2,3-dioxygenase-like lactoylglutathione lyase family enzyme